MRGFLLLICFAMSLIFSQAATAESKLKIETPAKTNALPGSPWQLIRLNEKVPPTRYRSLLWDGVDAIEAVANASMALLARPLDFDLKSKPILCWRWRIDAPLKTANLATKEGDDYAARVYVTFNLPSEAMSFSTRMKLSMARSIYGSNVPDAALNYVWDNRYSKGTKQVSAYTDRALIVVIQTGAELAGKWVMERRDVFADVVQAFGTDLAQPTLLAVAADTDNTGELARSGFADLHFVARDAACNFPTLH